MKLQDMSFAQLSDVIARANSDDIGSATDKGRLDAQGLVASDLKFGLPSHEVVRRCTSVLNEAATWKSADLEDVLVGTYGATHLAKIIGADVWAHGNLWREDSRQLTPEVCKWFADYTDAFIAELHGIITELAGTRWGN